MCIKIIGNEEQEFNASQPLENQIDGAKQIIVDYDPNDSRIDSFIGQMELMAKNGVNCTADIKININDYLAGTALKRKIEKLKKDMNVNELIKELAKFHYDTNRKLYEIEMSLGKINER